MTQTPAPNMLEYARSPEGVREIARRQRALLLCILGHIVIYIAMLAGQNHMPLAVLLLLLLLLVGVEVTAMVFVFLLSTKIYGTGVGILMGILTLVPCLGLLILLIVNGKATAILKSNGLKVGLLGAKVPPQF